MQKEEILNRINQLDDIKLNKFLCIADQILDLLYSGIDMSLNQMPFSEKLKKARKEKNITQVELAKKLNVTRGNIADIETNRRAPSKNLAKKLSEYFKTDMQYWI